MAIRGLTQMSVGQIEQHVRGVTWNLLSCGWQETKSQAKVVRLASPRLSESIAGRANNKSIG